MTGQQRPAYSSPPPLLTEGEVRRAAKLICLWPPAEYELLKRLTAPERLTVAAVAALTGGHPEGFAYPPGSLADLDMPVQTSLLPEVPETTWPTWKQRRGRREVPDEARRFMEGWG